MSALADSLLRQVTELKRRTDDLVGELDGGAPTVPRPEPVMPPEPVSAPDASSLPEPDPLPADGGRGAAELSAERLVALQMALSGSDRDEVAEYLRRSYATADPSATLDEIFGPAA